MAFFDEAKVGELTSRLSADAQIIQVLVTDKLSWFIRFMIQIGGSLFFMFRLSWKLALIVLAVVPIVIGVAAMFGGKLKRLQKQFQDKLAGANSIADECMK
jgi:ABC-type multidrug transport system fused ATPase/permease subunit